MCKNDAKPIEVVVAVMYEGPNKSIFVTDRS